MRRPAAATAAGRAGAPLRRPAAAPAAVADANGAPVPPESRRERSRSRSPAAGADASPTAGAKADAVLCTPATTQNPHIVNVQAYSMNSRGVLLLQGGQTFQLVDEETGEVMCTWDHGSILHTAVLSPSREFVVSAGMDRPHVKVWRVDQAASTPERCIDAMKTSQHVVAASFDPANPNHVAVISGQTKDVEIWDVSTGVQLDTLAVPGFTRCMCYLASPSRLVICDGAGTITVWSGSPRKVVARMSNPTQWQPASIQPWSLIPGIELITVNMKGVVYLWSLEKSKPARRLLTQGKGAVGIVRAPTGDVWIVKNVPHEGRVNLFAVDRKPQVREVLYTPGCAGAMDICTTGDAVVWSDKAGNVRKYRCPALTAQS